MNHQQEMFDILVCIVHSIGNGCHKVEFLRMTQLLRISFFLFLFLIPQSVIVINVLANYSTPYRLDTSSGLFFGGTIDQVIDPWWEAYKQKWRVVPYGDKECSYDLILYSDGAITGKFAAVILQGDCAGGGYVMGTFYDYDHNPQKNIGPPDC
jgi:hypothetical protein